MEVTLNKYNILLVQCRKQTPEINGILSAKKNLFCRNFTSFWYFIEPDTLASYSATIASDNCRFDSDKIHIKDSTTSCHQQHNKDYLIMWNSFNFHNNQPI